MRARQMMTRLDRLPKRPQGERKIPDFSLLPPEKQDLASELLKKMIASDDTQFAALHEEYDELTRDLPLIGPNDPEMGPVIEVPGELASHWRWQQPTSKWRYLNFFKLGKVQTFRFVELCERYGFKDGTSMPIKQQILPLHAWPSKDREELQRLLEVAAS